jgi:hypothetical protein
VVGVHEIELRRGVEVGEDRERHVVEPDVFAQGRAGIGRLGDQPAGEVLDVDGDARRRHVHRLARVDALEEVVDVVRPHRVAEPNSRLRIVDMSWCY